MRAAALALAALCLLAGSARADMDHNDAAWLATCGNSSGMPGGWSPIPADSTIPQELLAALDDEFTARFADNLTTWLDGNTWSCSPDQLDVQYAGCQQVVAGINYKLVVNLTCAINGANWTLGLDIDAFVPPGANESAVQIYDLDVDFIAKNGAIVSSDIDDMDGNDRWIYDTTSGSITDNANWTTDDDMWTDHSDHTDHTDHTDHDHDGHSDTDHDGKDD
ncbi:hypothetical protein ABPG77_008765 [Micractinium sp. CCAP 211/92]